MDIFELAKARVMSGGGKGFYSTEENDAGGTTYVFKAAKDGHFVKEKDVNFYDYDGTLLYSYTLASAQALTELPPLPEQKGLICQGWNWSLEDIKEHNRALDIGATYITDDGKTRLYIKIASEGRMDVPLYFSQTIANGVTIDWGDGSATETFDNTGIVTTVHTYASIGEYIISFDVVDGCELTLGDNSTSNCVLGPIGNNGKVYSNMLRKVEIGNKVVKNIGSTAFLCCSSLRSITIPNSVTSMGRQMCWECHSLSSVIIPNGVINLKDYSFQNCTSLAIVSIPNGVTSMYGSAFQGSCVLARIVLPNSVTQMGSFSGCSALENITIPNGVTSLYDNMFNNCSTLKSIIIPDGVTIINRDMFSGCSTLKSVTIPEGVTAIEQQTFYCCYLLENITIPNGVTTLNSNLFRYCYTLASITIPNSVTKIYSGVFDACYGMKFYDFTQHTAVPTLSGTSAFSKIPADCEIRVPSALYDEWVAATNWSTYADNIVPV
jgi:hypothetical protein